VLIIFFWVVVIHFWNLDLIALYHNTMGHITDFQNYGTVKMLPSFGEIKLNAPNKNNSEGTVSYSFILDNQGTKDLKNIDWLISFGRDDTSPTKYFSSEGVRGVNYWCGLWPLYGSNGTDTNKFAPVKVDLVRGKNVFNGVLPVKIKQTTELGMVLKNPLVLAVSFRFGSGYKFCYEYKVDRFFEGIDFEKVPVLFNDEVLKSFVPL
jgi:hypothetical protein